MDVAGDLVSNTIVDWCCPCLHGGMEKERQSQERMNGIDVPLSLQSESVSIVTRRCTYSSGVLELHDRNVGRTLLLMHQADRIIAL